ncbi:MAG: cobyrinate a,c-diamide synthase [Verrucomicrobiota bacterium]
MSGLILGGLHSSSGKTATTCLLLAAFSKRGYDIQPFKVGPDFIDPAYHNLYSSRESRTLDFWLMGGDEAVRQEAHEFSADCPGLVEGVMGLFDGWTPISESESTMHVGRLVDWPIVLVVPCAKAGRSLAVALRGFVEEAGRDRIAGVILNQVSGDSHRDYLEQAIKPLGLPVLGALPMDDVLVWPERHLGLRAAQEGGLPTRDDLAAFAEANLDVEALWEIAMRPSSTTSFAPQIQAGEVRMKLAVARDEAFHFYYPKCLDAFEVIPFSPLHDKTIPEADAIVLGGGFPEIYAEELSENREMTDALAGAIEDGTRVLAECGGFIYLSQQLQIGAERYPMVGAVPGAVEMTNRLQHFGYCLAGDSIRGHEFHHSRWTDADAHANLWQVAKRRTGQSRLEGFRTHNLEATYIHSLWTPERFS